MKEKIIIMVFVTCVIIFFLFFYKNIKDKSTDDEYYINYIKFNNYIPVKGILKNEYSKRNKFRRVRFNV